jgi:hypothetical protein
MNENYSDVNVSSGQGQGLAQVFAPYQPTYDMGQIGMVEAQNRAAQAKKAADKAAKISDLTGKLKIETLLPVDMAFADKKRKEIVDIGANVIAGTASQQDLDKAISDYDAFLAMGTGLYKEATGVLGAIQKDGLDAYENPDVLSGLYDDKVEVNAGNMFDRYQERLDKIRTITKKPPPFDYLKNINAAQNAVNPIQDGRRTYIDETMAKDAAETFITQDPDFNKFYQEQFKKLPPAEQKKYGDYVAFGVEDLSPQLVLNKRSPEPKGGNTYNNYPNNPEKVTEGVVTKQVRPIGAGGRNVDVRAFLYPKPVDLGARTKVDRMFKIDIDNETTPVDGNTPAVSYNETIEAPVSTVDVEWTGRDGIKRSVKKGQIVDPEDARKYAEIYTGQQIPTELALLSFGFDNANNKYYEPAERIAPSSVASFYGADGGTAKSQYTKEGIEKTAGGAKTTTPKALQGVQGR